MQRRILPSALHARHRPAVAVPSLRLDRRLLLEAQRGQALPAAFAEGLAFFWGVNFGHAHLDLLVGPRLAAAGCKGVAVSDGNDEA